MLKCKLEELVWGNIDPLYMNRWLKQADKPTCAEESGVLRLLGWWRLLLGRRRTASSWPPQTRPGCRPSEAVWTCRSAEQQTVRMWVTNSETGDLQAPLYSLVSVLCRNQCDFRPSIWVRIPITSHMHSLTRAFFSSETWTRTRSHCQLRQVIVSLRFKLMCMILAIGWYLWAQCCSCSCSSGDQPTIRHNNYFRMGRTRTACSDPVPAQV